MLERGQCNGSTLAEDLEIDDYLEGAHIFFKGIRISAHFWGESNNANRINGNFEGFLLKWCSVWVSHFSDPLFHAGREFFLDVSKFGHNLKRLGSQNGAVYCRELPLDFFMVHD